MRFNRSYSVSISVEELEKLLPENAVKRITDECHVESLTDLHVSVLDNSEIMFFTVL